MVTVVGYDDDGLIVDDPFGTTKISTFYTGGTRWSTLNDSNNTVYGGDKAGESVKWLWSDIIQIRFRSVHKIKKQ
jgi:hypothetical protein